MCSRRCLPGESLLVDPGVSCDALLVVSFGGPEGPADVMPFLENVTRGRGVPRQRLLEVAKNYESFGGVSPINAHNRALIAAVEAELERVGPPIPVYFGNRNWHPFLEDAVHEMAADGVGCALAFATSAYSSYSGCRQYLEDIAAARAVVGVSAPRIDKLRAFWNHPGFIEPLVDHVTAALATVPAGARASVRLVFTAHSLPVSMARQSDYEMQLRDACELVVARLADPPPWELAFQSRSGPAAVPWLGPDILDRLSQLAVDGVRHVVNLPIGFVTDHMEVVYDLDTRARQHAEQLGVGFTRVATVGTDPRFVSMIRELIVERTVPGTQRRALGTLGPRPDTCAADCCPAPRRSPG